MKYIITQSSDERLNDHCLNIWNREGQSFVFHYQVCDDYSFSLIRLILSLGAWCLEGHCI